MRRMSRPYHPLTHPRYDEVTETVRHAKRAKVKNLESELSEVRFKLNELVTENRTLKRLLRRQETTLKHYEGSETSLPQIIQTHEEDVRVLKMKLKKERFTVSDLQAKLKAREEELLPLKHEYNKLVKLSKQRNLGEREKLTEEVERQKEIIKEKNEKISLLTRRVMLETKNFNYKLDQEQRKQRDSQRILVVAQEECDRLRKMLDDKQKFISINAFRFAGQRGYSLDRSAVTVNGTTFPGLEAQMKSDPRLLWDSKILSAELDTDQSSSLVESSLTPAISSNPRLAITNARKKASTRVPLDLPAVGKSSEGSNETSVYERNQSNDLDSNQFSNEVESNKEESEVASSGSKESENLDVSSDEEAENDNSSDEEADAEIQRIEAGSDGNEYGHEISVTLTGNGSLGSDVDENDNESGERKKPLIVQLLEDENFIPSNDDGGETPDMSIFIEMEKKMKQQKDKTIEMRAEYEKYKEEERQRYEKEQKAKLLAALEDIDKGREVPVGDIKVSTTRKASIFTKTSPKPRDRALSSNTYTSISQALAAEKDDMSDSQGSRGDSAIQRPKLIQDLFGTGDLMNVKDFATHKMLNRLERLSLGDKNKESKAASGKI